MHAEAGAPGGGGGEAWHAAVLIGRRCAHEETGRDMVHLLQGWQGRWGALTSAPRPAPPGKISAPRPTLGASAPGLAWASPSPVDPLTYLAQG